MYHLISLLFLILVGCDRTTPDDTLQGYVEGDYLFIAPVTPGRLTQVTAARGDGVQEGQLLFVQDESAEQTALATAEARRQETASRLENLLSGLRPDELQAIEMQKRQAEAALRLSLAQRQRQEELTRTQNASPSQLDAARAAVERDQAQVAEADSRLRSARLAARPAEIDAARAALAAAEAGVDQARWSLAQRRGHAPRPGRVEEVLFAAGEVAGAGQPVISLLPPERVTVRAYASTEQVGRLLTGTRVGLACAGCPAGMAGTVVFVASEAAYAPPVLYSREGKEKLVFRMEVRPESPPEGLRPGQPVTLTLPPRG